MPVGAYTLPTAHSPPHSTAGQENSDTFLLVTPVVKIVCFHTRTAEVEIIGPTILEVQIFRIQFINSI